VARRERRIASEEMEITPTSLPWKSVYKILLGSVLPRPIGWISSINIEGQVNLAPFSFFNVVCPNPPTVLFCPNIRSTDKEQKDTVNNVRATGEFVVNIVTEDLAEAMNITSTEFPAEVNEFESAGLTAAPSLVIRPPRVAESPIHFECRLMKIIDIGSEPGGGSIVIGEIVQIHVDESVLLGIDKVDVLKLKPIGRLAGNDYCRVTDIFQMTRAASKIVLK
jgi:flavin reductase (DIM6/NTAB) family NADH-FMN oxidoreductase RutF